MNPPSPFPLPRAAQPLPALASHHRAGNTTDATSAEIGRLLARTLGDESELYAITRDWRYDAAVRKFTRLHTLLDEQFTEIGLRIVAVAARSRALDLHVSTGVDDRAPRGHAAVDGSALEARVTGELLALHEALLVRLRAGKTMSEHFHDGKTTGLLADLIANHEKDAFMLRALLWEVQNTAA